MASLLCITVRYLQPYTHGRGEDGSPEWPPSPLRLMQAMVAASAGRWNERSMLQHATAAIRWLETLPPPSIIAPCANPSEQPYRLYVPDNVADKVATSWAQGHEADIADYRTEKDVSPSLLDGEAVHYLYCLPAHAAIGSDFVEVLTAAARAITHLGWGIDMAIGNAAFLTPQEAAQLEGVRWLPSRVGGTPLRVPKVGTLDDLMRKHRDFLNRITAEGFRPAPPLHVFNVVRYRRADQPLSRPYRLFELRNLDGSRFRYPHRRLIHIAGMVRHLAIKAMKTAPPPGVPQNWVECYVAGHADASGNHHRQFSYLPLPSVGHEHTDPGVRRVMIVAPLGDEAWLNHLARQLAGLALRPDPDKPVAIPGDPPLLIPIRIAGDGVTRRYTTPAAVWHSFTPVILPGHNDHKSDKTQALIERALAQAGIDQPCDFAWSAFSYFSKSYSAHKYDKNKQPQGYFRPDHLQSQTAIHLTLRFHDGSPDKKPIAVPGPLVVGAGRHCGFGLMVGETHGDPQA